MWGTGWCEHTVWPESKQISCNSWRQRGLLGCRQPVHASLALGDGASYLVVELTAGGLALHRWTKGAERPGHHPLLSLVATETGLPSKEGGADLSMLTLQGVIRHQALVPLPQSALQRLRTLQLPIPDARGAWSSSGRKNIRTEKCLS